VRFVSAAGIWEVPARPRPCTYCGDPGAFCTYVSELVEARKGPGDQVFCDVYCWGKHLDATVFVRERTGEPRMIPRIRVWGDVAGSLPETGDQGFTVSSDRFRDQILYRLANGKLVGVLRHFPRGRQRALGPWEVAVHPDHRGERIGSMLSREAARRWGVDLNYQRSTAGGLRMERHALRPSPGRPEDVEVEGQVDPRN